MDYKKLGFKCGIEIHQQLEGRKLFSLCPTEIRKDKHDYELIRYLRASKGEGGKKDKAAQFEQDKKKRFRYYGYNNTTSLVETDEEPPSKVSEDAVVAAVQVAKLLNCELVDRVEYMRKVVIDGSNVSGFQRTAIIGMNGWVEIKGKKYGVETVCLEEEACQAVKRTETEDIYNLSRLGIPLIEIATAPDMKTPEECKEVAEHIGLILRSIPNCKRGIGSIRQDVNISVKGGVRVEIKGFQDLRSIPKVIDYEINRQLKSKDKEPHVRKAEANFTTSFLRPMPGAARMYPETDVRSFTLPSVTLPKLIADKQKEIKKLGISEDLVKELAKKDIDIVKLANDYENVKTQTIAEFFTVIPKEIRRKEGKEFHANKHLIILEKLNEGKISVESVRELALQAASGKKLDFSKYEVLSEKEVDKVLQNIIDGNKGAPMGALMGLAMKELRGKADGKLVMDLLQKKLK